MQCKMTDCKKRTLVLEAIPVDEEGHGLQAEITHRPFDKKLWDEASRYNIAKPSMGATVSDFTRLICQNPASVFEKVLKRLDWPQAF